MPPEPALGEGECVIQEDPAPLVDEHGLTAAGVPEFVENHPEWDEYHDWQQQVRLGKTRLSYEEWKKERGKWASWPLE